MRIKKMGAKKAVSVYGIKLESLQTLLKLVGYKSRTSEANILKNYGSLEAFVQKRFNALDEAEAKELLMQEMQPKAGRQIKDELIEGLIKKAVIDFVFSMQADEIIAVEISKKRDDRTVEQVKKDMINYL